jgi:hypothetical protein
LDAAHRLQFDRVAAASDFVIEQVFVTLAVRPGGQRRTGPALRPGELRAQIAAR